MTMRKLLIAAVALAALSGAAEAAPKLPDAMVGNWCVDLTNPNDPNPTILLKGKCAHVDWVGIRRDGFSADAMNCQFTKLADEKRSQFRIGRRFEAKCEDGDGRFIWKGALGLRYDGLVVLEKWDNDSPPEAE
jgi:hypothetical protein